MKMLKLEETAWWLALGVLTFGAGGLQGCADEVASARPEATSSAPATREGAGDLAPAAQVASATLDAEALVAQLKIGWNLGNSLEAVGGETAWGNPRVTPSLIRAVADAGFGAVRIPVTWVRHFGAGPSYPIDAAWIARVAEVVGYVLDSGMVAIINVHHDGAEGGDGEWLSLRDRSGQLSAAHDSTVRAQFTTIWRQIARHFASHGPKLVFESMNEIKVGYGTPDPAYYRTINALNQAFVDVVRASGGNNATRTLVVPGYNTNIAYTLAGFVAPRDSVPKRLVLSVHYYDPWSFAGEAKTRTWGVRSPGSDTWGQEDWVRAQFDRLKTTYVNAGLPVILGEYGAVHQTGSVDHRRYYMEYVTKAAVERGIAPFYWDNGAAEPGPEGFGLFDRNSNRALHPEVLEATLRAAREAYPLASVRPPR